MKRTITFLVMAVILFAIGCSKTEIEPQPVVNTQSQPDFKSGTSDIPILINENIAGGNLRIYDDADGIYMIATLNGWEFYQNYIYIGTEPPTSPSPGQFPYSGTVNPSNTANFSISFDELGATEGDFYIAFYAKVKPIQGGNTADAWAVSNLHFYFYNNGGNQVGWGSYFVYSVSGYDPIIHINHTDTPLTSFSGKVRYRNFMAYGEGPEIYFWADNALVPESQDFNPIGGPAATYNIGGSLVNHIRLEFAPEATTTNAFLHSMISVSSIFHYTIFPLAAPDFNVIQLKFYREYPVQDFMLFNLTVNGQPLTGNYQGRDFEGALFNITGDLLPPNGLCIFEADLKIFEPALNPDDNYIEISYGNL